MDYCTLFPEGWSAADKALLQCVADSAPYPILTAAAAGIGCVMYLGVRVFGRRFYRKAGELL